MNIMHTDVPRLELSKDRAAKALGLETYDLALPQQWLDKVSGILKNIEDVYQRILSSVVWCYDGKGNLFGYPHPLTIEAYGLLKACDRAEGTHYMDEIDQQINVLDI